MITERGIDMNESRTKKSIVNSMTSVITQVLTVILNFVVKTVFIHTLGQEYLGVNGLFTNIITMLSLADLGIGIAIPYSLYKPLAEKDHHKITILMKFYKKIYTTIGFIVILVGLSLTPFLPYLIKGETDISNLSFIYILFVLHSASSYFFVYKKFLIDSDQKGYLTSRIAFFFSTLLNFGQILILVLTKNYVVYLVASIVTIVCQNLYISYKANKMYPYINDKTDDKLSKEDVKEIKKNVSALFIYKIGSVITNGTDNIVISKFLGLIPVGLYSNYILIVNSVNNILSQLFTAITSSIGNLVVTASEKRSKNVFECLTFLNFWLYSLFSICLCVLFNPFIDLWIGDKYLLGFSVVFLLSLNFYLSGMSMVTTSFRNAYGLFWKGKYRPVIMVIINIVVSILLVKPLGVAGVLVGTIVSRILTVAWIDPYIVYHDGFHRSSKRYFVKYIIFIIIFLATTFLTNYLMNFIPHTTFLWFILKGLCTFIFVNVVFLIIFHGTGEFKYFYEKIESIYKRFRQKRTNKYDTLS